jgi:hypothetical protein
MRTIQWCKHIYSRMNRIERLYNEKIATYSDSKVGQANTGQYFVKQDSYMQMMGTFGSGTSYNCTLVLSVGVAEKQKKSWQSHFQVRFL